MTDLRSTAIHEAGHVVAAMRLGIEQREVTILQDEWSAGAATGEGLTHVWSREQAESMAQMYCAGYAALVVAGYDEARATLGCGSDFEQVELLKSEWNLAAGIEEWKTAAVALMGKAENKRAVQVVADHLIAHKTLDADYLFVVLQLADGEYTELEFRQYLQLRKLRPCAK